MPTVCFDPIGGAAGDMILASLLDLGADVREVDRRLRSTGLTGFDLAFERRRDSQHIQGGFCRVSVAEEDHGHDHRHDHGHGRHLPDILAMIEAGDLAERAQSRARTIFERLAFAESAVHGISPEEVHFHEVGAVDSIVDIVGTCIALELLDVESVFCGPFKIGSGTVTCAHGVLPVPAPATAKLLEGWPFERLPVDGECTTPTGAAILTALSEGPWEGVPLRMTRGGAGQGSRQHPGVPNVIRAYLCEAPPNSEALEVLQTDIDDDTPERIADLAERLRNAGARDVVLLPTIMKKGRAGTRLEVLVERHLSPELVDVLLRESSTIGVRAHSVRRCALSRTPVSVETPWGLVQAKCVERPDGPETVPEYESCRALAESAGVSLRRVMQAAGAAAHTEQTGG